MKILLNTQVFLWFVLNDSALSQIACDVIVAFDRLLIAQALTEKIPIISADKLLDNYSTTRYW